MIPQATRRNCIRRTARNALADGLLQGWGGQPYTAEEVEFMKAMDDYKRRKKRPFPTWREVLEVLRTLGYRKYSPSEERKDSSC